MYANADEYSNACTLKYITKKHLIYDIDACMQ